MYDDDEPTLVDAVLDVARYLRALGNGSAADGGIGAIENLSMSIESSCDKIALSLDGIAAAIEAHGRND